MIVGNDVVDSPGHGVECGTCVMMDVNSKKIMSLVTMEKKEMDKESSAENCFVKAMNDLLEKDVNVEEVVTNAHMQLGSAMSKNYLIPEDVNAVLYFSMLQCTNVLYINYIIFNFRESIPEHQAFKGCLASCKKSGKEIG